MNKLTTVWGVAADGVGAVVNVSEKLEELSSGGVRVERRTRLEHEPASSYAGFHAWPMEMRWQHSEPIGWVRSLRRAHGRLYAVGETELEPDELRDLAGEQGLKWSTGTNTRRGQPLRIVEVSLVSEAATVGLPAVSWYKRDVTKGNPPAWVTEELARAEKLEHRSREMLVNEVGAAIETTASSAADEYAAIGRELGLLPPVEPRVEPRVLPRVEPRYGDGLEHSTHPGGRVIRVGGRRVVS